MRLLETHYFTKPSFFKAAQYYTELKFTPAFHSLLNLYLLCDNYELGIITHWELDGIKYTLCLRELTVSQRA